MGYLSHLGFLKTAETDAEKAENAAKVIYERHPDPKKSKVTDEKHKASVVGNVISSYGVRKGGNKSFDAKHLTSLLDKNLVNAYADTTYHPDKTIKGIKHTLAFPSKGGDKLLTPATTRSYDGQLTSGLKTKRTGATEQEAAKQHNDTLRQYLRKNHSLHF